MQLTLFSDYSLRILLYLAANPAERVTLPEISVAYGISQHHLVKVTQRLIEEGWVESTRGRGGGLCLACEPSDINIGKVVRVTEPHMNMAECFDPVSNTCPIDGVCGLKKVLLRAREAFLEELDRHTLADFKRKAPLLTQLWNRRLDEDRKGRADA
jgi:Rrf2 family nitric oxide-sensitive transcriptional repressor